MITNAPGPVLAGNRAPRWADGISWVGRKVRLREIRPADRRTLTGFDRDSAAQAGGYRHWATHRAATAGGDFHFAIDTLHSRTLVGSVWLQTDPTSGWFSYGIGIGAQHRRCGYAGDAAAILLAFMFEQRHYRRCEVSVHGANFASLSLHGALGFREEGRPRDTELLCGEISYPVLMSITADQFRRTPPDLHRRSRPRPPLARPTLANHSARQALAHRTPPPATHPPDAMKDPFGTLGSFTTLGLEPPSDTGRPQRHPHNPYSPRNVQTGFTRS